MKKVYHVISVAIATWTWGFALQWAWFRGFCPQAVVSALVALLLSIMCFCEANREGAK